jgi:hypothetical protein
MTSAVETALESWIASVPLIPKFANEYAAQ